jgi:hypothetical protein
LKLDAQAASTDVTVIIATGLNFPDALSGGLLSSAYGAPLLLVEKDSVPSSVAAEITRMKATRAIVLGGEAAVGSKVVTALRGLGVTTVERVKGSNRYDTSAAIAARATIAVEQARQTRLAEIQDAVSDAKDTLGATLADGLADLQSQIDGIAGRVDAGETELAALRVTVTDAVSGLQSQIDTLAGRVDLTEGADADLDARLSSVEASLTVGAEGDSAFWPVDMAVVGLSQGRPSRGYPEEQIWHLGIWAYRLQGHYGDVLVERSLRIDDDRSFVVFRIDGVEYTENWGGGTPPTEGAPIEVEYWCEYQGQMLHGTETIPGGWTYEGTGY